MRNKRKDAKFRNAEVTRESFLSLSLSVCVRVRVCVCGSSIYVCVFSSVFVFLFLCSLHVLSACLQTHAKRRRRMFPLRCLCVSLSVYVCAFVGYGNEKQTERRKISKCGHHTREKERDRESEAVCKRWRVFSPLKHFVSPSSFCMCVCVCACACTYVDLAFGLQLCSALILCTLSISTALAAPVNLFMRACVCV